ncbi:retrovirus-related pol polyprotein from transposon TNT 1-94 [Tanacetum coccineum]
MASQDTRLSKFEADFKQQQGEMTNKIDTVLKAITDRLAGSLPSDMVKNLKLNTYPILSAHSYPTIDPQCSSHPFTSINLRARKNGSAFVQGEVSAKMEDPRLFTLLCRLGDSKPFDTLVDLGSCVNIIPRYLFKKLNIGLLEETDHIFGLADVEVHIGKLKLLNDFYVIDMKKDTETPLLVGRGFLATANAVIDCEEEAPYWTTLGKMESYKPRPSSDGVGDQIPYNARKDFLDCHLPEEWEITRDVEINHFNDVLVFIRMNKPPKNGDGAWHAKIRLIDPNGEEFTKTLQSIPTTRNLSERESPRKFLIKNEEEFFTDAGDGVGINTRRRRVSRNVIFDEKKLGSSYEICLGVDLEPDEWIKDSGCSKHMTGNRKLFSSYKAYNGGNVIFGSNLRGNIIGKGQICDNKCRVTFSEHDSEITKDGKVIGRGIRKKGLYVMKLGNKPKDKICLATIDENSTLWHRRLGHANMRLIQSLASKELVRNLPKLKFDQHFCDACKIGKQAHASHKAKNIVLMTRCLELLHMDLFGPSAVRSYRGNRYTLVIVDDYSRYTWTRFLKDKTEAFDQFEIFLKRI